MGTNIKSGDNTASAGLFDLQNEVASTANDIPISGLSRSILSSDNFDDSIMYTARSFGINERDIRSSIGSFTTKYPESIGSSSYADAPVAPDIPVTGTQTSIKFAEHRLKWRLHPRYSSRNWAEEPTATGVTADVTDAGNWGGGKYGKRLFNIKNDGNAYSMFFHVDLNIALNAEDKGDPKITAFMPGRRFWTSVVYFLRPSVRSTRVLKWSPGHMLCGTGAIDNSKMFRPGAIGITHSYTDIIRVNKPMIKALCSSLGIDYVASKMELDDTSYFGWAVMSANDRWDYIHGLVWEAREVVEGRSTTKIVGGNINFIAFKDDSGGAGLTSS
jgi:hypothetical protein